MNASPSRTGRRGPPPKGGAACPGRAAGRGHPLPKEPRTAPAAQSPRLAAQDPAAEREGADELSEDERPPLLPGLKPVLELLLNAPERVDTVFLRKGRHSKDMKRVADLCRACGIRFSLLEAGLFSRLYAGNSQGVVARLYEAGYVAWEDLLDSAMAAPLPLILALDQVQDPGNAGTLARTLYALGGAGLVLPRHKGVYLGAAAAKAAAGALERLPVARVPNLGQALDNAKKHAFTIYGASAGRAREDGRSTDPAFSLDVFSLDAASPELCLPAILVLGSEEKGMRPGLEKRCDTLLHVPMLRDFDSLNVAQAGGILISCFVRNRLNKER